VVTQRSFLTSTLTGAKPRKDGFQTALLAQHVSFACGVHNELLSNAEVQNRLFIDLVSK
jgi:hypothetical protein